jgi:hypothetical protein
VGFYASTSRLLFKIFVVGVVSTQTSRGIADFQNFLFKKHKFGKKTRENVGMIESAEGVSFEQWQ